MRDGCGEKVDMIIGALDMNNDALCRYAFIFCIYVVSVIDSFSRLTYGFSEGLSCRNT